MFGAILNDTLPGPCPVAGENDTQVAWLVAFQVHSLLVEMVTFPLPPSGPKLLALDAADTAHLLTDGPVTFVDAELHAHASVAASRMALASRTAREGDSRRLLVPITFFCLGTGHAGHSERKQPVNQRGCPCIGRAGTGIASVTESAQFLARRPAAGPALPQGLCFEPRCDVAKMVAVVES